MFWCSLQPIIKFDSLNLVKIPDATATNLEKRHSFGNSWMVNFILHLKIYLGLNLSASSVLIVVSLATRKTQLYILPIFRHVVHKSLSAGSCFSYQGNACHRHWRRFPRYRAWSADKRFCDLHRQQPWQSAWTLHHLFFHCHQIFYWRIEPFPAAPRGWKAMDICKFWGNRQIRHISPYHHNRK